MPLNISGYTDPGTYIGEQNTPSAISISTVPDVLGIVAYGSRVKRSINEAVKRGQVLDESVTFAGSSPHTYTLLNRGDRKQSNTVLSQTVNSSTTVVPSSALVYLAASLTGTAAGTYDLSTNNAIGLTLDGLQPITMTFAAGAAAVVITGSLVAVTSTFGSIAAATRAEVAAAINAGLAAAGALGYGAAYNAVASDATTGIKITSPVTTPNSDVQLLNPFVHSAVTTLGFTAGAHAPTILQILDQYYVSTATYSLNYVSLSTTVDPLLFSALSVIKVGNFANVTSYKFNQDYVLNSGDIDWSSSETAATLTGLAGTFDVSTNNTVSLAFDNKATIAVKLNALGSPPPGYVNPVSPSAATAAEMANNINAIMSTAAGYGPAYKAVASVNGSGKLVLTTPTAGAIGNLSVLASSSLDASQALFGLTPTQLPFMVIGTGAEPVPGALYFATYTYQRPTAEYNTPKRYFGEDQMIQDLTPVSSTNQLAIYGQVAFINGAPSIVVCQVNDQTVPASPTPTEVMDAIDGIKNSSVTTDVCVADTRLAVQTYLMAHIEQESSPTEANYRVGWFGMPIGTAIGDKDTAGTFVFMATQTLQVSPDSPARGRMNLVAPTNIQRTIQNEDGTEATLNFDSTLLACAVAGLHTSHTSPSQSLASQFVVGFEVDTFPLFKKGERKQMASNGVLVVTGDTGKFQILDPVTTEMGGGKLAKFGYRSAISQKDATSRAVAQAVDDNLRGVVPDNLSDFIFDIKTFISGALTSLIGSGAIGPFRDANGNTRDIDLTKDIQVQQDKNDPTKFLFNYDFFLKYPALRFFGQFTVDNPFFGG